MHPGQNSRTDSLIGIQILRGWAALAVVVHHVIEAQYFAAASTLFDVPTIVVGSAGVDVFFVISGVIMMTSSFPARRPALDPAAFLLRRVQRIYPLYWLCAAPLLMMIVAGFGVNQPHTAETIVRSLLLMPSNAVVLNYSWTLHFEMYFYVLFAIALIFAEPLRAVGVTAGLLVLLAGLGHFVPDAPFKALMTNPIVFEFALGLLLGYVYLKAPAVFSRHRWAWSLAALGAVCVMVASTWMVALDQTNGPIAAYRFFVWGLPAAVIVAWGIGLKHSDTSLTRTQVQLGDASYALYLSHYFIVTAYWRAMEGRWTLPDVWHLAVAPLAIVLCCVVGVWVHSQVEKPLLGVLRRGGQKQIAARS